jgi:NADPH:quinone reductase-like Zn-dependent oxidoreductase
MLSINVSSYSKPSGYQLSQLPKPVVEADTDVVIKVHAASINPVDVKKTDGKMKLILKDR